MPLVAAVRLRVHVGAGQRRKIGLDVGVLALHDVADMPLLDGDLLDDDRAARVALFLVEVPVALSVGTFLEVDHRLHDVEVCEHDALVYQRAERDPGVDMLDRRHLRGRSPRRIAQLQAVDGHARTLQPIQPDVAVDREAAAGALFDLPRDGVAQEVELPGEQERDEDQQQDAERRPPPRESTTWSSVAGDCGHGRRIADSRAGFISQVLMFDRNFRTPRRRGPTSRTARRCATSPARPARSPAARCARTARA